MKKMFLLTIYQHENWQNQTKPTLCYFDFYSFCCLFVKIKKKKKITRGRRVSKFIPTRRSFHLYNKWTSERAFELGSNTPCKLARGRRSRIIYRLIVKLFRSGTIAERWQCNDSSPRGQTDFQISPENAIINSRAE